jgi:hypothetical protein
MGTSGHGDPEMTVALSLSAVAELSLLITISSATLPTCVERV